MGVAAGEAILRFVTKPFSRGKCTQEARCRLRSARWGVFDFWRSRHYIEPMRCCRCWQSLSHAKKRAIYLLIFLLISSPFYFATLCGSAQAAHTAAVMIFLVCSWASETLPTSVRRCFFSAWLRDLQMQ